MQPLIVDNIPNPTSGVDAGFDIKIYEKSGFHLPWHLHNTFELTYIQKGSGQRIIGNRIDPFGPGDTVLLAPNVPHAWKTHDRGPNGSARAITLKFAPDFPCVGLLDLPELAPVASVLRQAKRGLVLEGKLKDRVIYKLERISDQSKTRQLLAAMEILVTISEANETHTLLPSNEFTTKNSESLKTKQVIDFIFEQYANPIDANILASVAGIHPSSLGRLFKRTTGFTPTEFISQVRINKACQLLTNPQKSIVDICHESGFQNLSYFNRVFRTLRGCSPSQYRKELGSIAPDQAQANS